MKKNVLKQALCLLLCLAGIARTTKVAAQNCGPANTIYGISTDQQNLLRIDTATGVSTTIGNVFGGGSAATAPSTGTSAIAVDPTTGMIWFCNRNNGANVYSYTPGASSPYGTTAAAFGISGAINKAAYNPADGQIYFHDGSTNTLFRFNPATPNAALVSVGNLGLTGITTTAASFSGGDIAFDGLGNLTGAFSSQNVLAVFPANYDANGNYLGINLGQGVVIANFSTAVASLAFLPSGDYLSGGGSGVIRVNTNTATQTTVSTTTATADFASCAAPAPNLVVSKTASSSCTGTNQITITYTVTVQNTGQFAAINTRIFDQVPAGLTITGATLNGTAIPGANNALFSTGNGPLISSTGAAAFQNGVMERGESATIVITATAVPGTYSNQAGISYTGVEKLNLPNDRVPSNNPATAAANDATVLTGGCSSLAGTVFNDANGMTNSLVDGTGTGLPGGTQLYVNLVNSSGVVIATVPVNANGTYSIANIPNGSFTAQISTTQAEIGQSAPAQLLPAGWVNTGESFGGVNDATVGGGLAVTVNAVTTNANFGIERLPESYPVTYSVAGAPTLTSLATQALQGSDPEDQTAQGSWTGKTFVVDTLPTNGYVLKYNGSPVTAGVPIPNYNPALLTIQPGAVGSGSVGTSTTTFKYSTIDAAGKKDPTPAAYTVNWSIPLPAQLLSFHTTLMPDCSILVSWKTGIEDNLKHFVLERSNDGIVFDPIISHNAKGSHSIYDYKDEQANEGIRYYRLQMVDRDGIYAYSPVRKVSAGCMENTITVLPTLVQEQVLVSGLKAGAQIRIFSLEGKELIRTTTYTGQHKINTASLVPGQYAVQAIQDGKIMTTIKIMKL